MKNEIKEITAIITRLQDCGRKRISPTEGVIVNNKDIATALYEAGYREQSETVNEFAEKIMDKNCRNCEHAFLETCKGCNTLPPNNTYENFELRKDITAEKHRADVAEEALRNGARNIQGEAIRVGGDMLELNGFYNFETKAKYFSDIERSDEWFLKI